MSSSPADPMFKDFGFNSKAHFIGLRKLKPKERYRYYDFKWRLKMASKYKNISFLLRWDKNLIIAFFNQYEYYVIINQKGSRVNSWPKNAKNQYEYLFKRLVKPWTIIKHGSSLYSIKDPNNIFWFRALETKELFKAMDICNKISKRTRAKTKPWVLSLKWSSCVLSYMKKRNTGALWIGKDYDVALTICDNIISTWDTKTGDWKPWNSKWCKLAHNDLRHSIKYGQFKHLGTAGVSSSITKGLNSISTTKIVTFSDISNWVHKKGSKGMKQAAFMLLVAFWIGGSRAAKIITSFRKQHGIPSIR